MFFNDENFTICRICGESNLFGTSKCQNCKSTLNNRRFRINNDRNNNTNSSYPKIKKLIIEKLEAKKMTFDLYTKDSICCICQENILEGQSIYILSCTHCFHQNCANKWFEKKNQCPYCRKKYLFY